MRLEYRIIAGLTSHAYQQLLEGVAAFRRRVLPPSLPALRQVPKLRVRWCFEPRRATGGHCAGIPTSTPSFNGRPSRLNTRVCTTTITLTCT
jgi:hypothetical protein